MVEHSGHRMSLKAWARRLGVNYSTLKTRILKFGVEAGLSSRDLKSKKIRHGGVTRSMSEWARYYGVGKSAFSSMVKSRGRRKAFQFYDAKLVEGTGTFKVFVEFDGHRMSIRDAAFVTGVSEDRIRDRLRKGICDQRLFEPDGLNRRYLTVRGERKHISQWGKDTGLGVNAIFSRIRRVGLCDEIVDAPKRRSSQEQHRTESELMQLGFVY